MKPVTLSERAQFLESFGFDVIFDAHINPTVMNFLAHLSCGHGWQVLQIHTFARLNQNTPSRLSDLLHTGQKSSGSGGILDEVVWPGILG
jgi:hypothetical protein